jgi:hypothetical protein
MAAFSDVVRNVRDVVETPLTQPLDFVHVFLIVGVVLIAIGFWHLILSHLGDKLTVE